MVPLPRFVIGPYPLFDHIRYRAISVIGPYRLSGRTLDLAVPVTGPCSGYLLGEKRPDNEARVYFEVLNSIKSCNENIFNYMCSFNPQRCQNVEIIQE
jgi:hypothetical protein